MEEKEMEKNEQILKQGSFLQLAVNLCIPTIVIMLVMVIYNMADTYFIGKTGDPCKIAAVSLCAPVFSILSGLGTLLGSGGCTVVSLSLGKKEYDRIKACTSLCCYGSLVIGLIFSAAVLMNLTGISSAIGANEDTLGYTRTYLRILAFGGPIILFGNVFNNLIRGDGSAKQSMISNGLGTIVNKQKIFSLDIRDLSLKKEVILPIVTLGLPLACSTIMMSFSHMFMNHILAGYGSVAVAASGVAGKVSMVVSMIAMGLCMGMQPAISYNCGAEDYKRMYQIIRNLGILTVIVGSLMTVGCLIGKSSLVAAFIEHEDVIRLGEKMVVASMLMGPFYGLYQLCTTFLQSTGKASYATVVALLDKGIIYLPMLFGLNALFGLDGVIYTAPLTDMVSLLAGGVLCFLWNKKLPGSSQR